jgi:diguanylate cyclase (GGDEF)-like protein/PAS domain S-box-containing protein
VRLLGRWFGGQARVFVLLAVAVFVVQLLLPEPVLLAYGLLLSAAIVLVADPVRVAALSGVCLVLGALAPFLDPTPAGGYWERYPWLIPFAVLAVALARVERDRVRRIARSAQLLDEVVEATSQPVFAKRFGRTPGAPAGFELANEAWRRVVGAGDAPVPGLTDAEVFSPEALEAMRPDEEAVARSRAPATFEQHLTLADGEERTYLTTIFPLLGDGDEVTGIGGIATDVTERARAEERLAAVFAHSPVPSLRMVTGGGRRTRVLDANQAVRALVGLDAVGLGTDDLFAVVHPQDRALTRTLMDDVVGEAIGSGGSVAGAAVLGREVRLLDAEGRVRWVILSVSPVGRPSADGEQELIVQFEDITTLKNAEAALTERALTDPVTGLPNRYALTDRLSMALARLSRRPGLVCVLFCDLDQFKQVNDAFGHEVGDGLLAEVGERLVSAVRPEDSVGRLGGDEFVVVCEGFGDPSEAAALAGRLQEHLRAPWSFAGHEFAPAASIGIAFTDDPSCPTGDLLRQADVAMYRAKDSGRDRVEIYDRSLDDELEAAMEMQEKLRAALSSDGFVLHYQPVMLLDGLVVVGAEALVRMRDGAALLPPAAFLGQAESSGLIGELGAWVLDRALGDLAAWPGAAPPSSVGINVSPSQLVRPGFADSVLSALERHDVAPKRLVVEVTETALLDRRGGGVETLQALHAAGVLIALDDFGTGYSSLAWLHELPVDIVKIDRGFVQAMVVDHRRAVVVRSVIEIAEEIGLAVTAEGVETERQLAMLRDFGCESAQGFLLGRPAPIDDPAWGLLTRGTRGWDDVRGPRGARR